LNRHKDIPADIKLCEGKLVVNEYNLTGEKTDINKFEGDIATTRLHLLKYCERDTEGMVVIWKHLMSL
jgi:magnesium-transporting ATPase (P-type)